MSPSARKNAWRGPLIAVVLLLLLGIGVFMWMTRTKPLAVVLRAVDRGSVESTVVNTRAGTVEACQRTRLSTIMGGRIEFLGVREGDRVKKGQLLMKLWNDDQRAQQRLAETQLVSARERVKEACTTAANARREADRQTSLKSKGYVSDAREEAARSEAVARQAACDTVQADVIQAEARISVVKAEQGRTALYAPFAGTVAKIVGELGEYSTPSPPGVPTPPAIDLIDETCLYVKAPMDEIDAPKIRSGMLTRISLDALPKQPFPGKVRRIAPFVSAVEKQARTVDVEVDFDKLTEGRLLVGYSADVEIVLDVRANTIRVPTAALMEGARVLVFNPETEKLDERKLKIGLANWEYTEVLEGLAEGERIVTSLEREGVRAGVRVVPASAGPGATSASNSAAASGTTAARQ